MENIPIHPADYRRNVSKSGFLSLVNRFVEQNPVLTDQPVSFISRPGLRRFLEVGTGPIRALYSSAGAFNSDLFVVSGLDLYRVSSTTGVSSLIGTISTTPVGSVSMAATSPIGTEVPSYLFIAEGGNLWCFTENGHALGRLEASAIASGNTVQLGSVYYQWTSSSVDAGTPAGTVGAPWLVALGASVVQSLQNLFEAINGTGAPGTTHSTALVEHPTLEATAYTPTELFVTARIPGVTGNGIATIATGAGINFVAASTSGGGLPQLIPVSLPNDAGAISVTYINSFVIVVPVQDDSLGTTGKFYWIEPGERTVDPLNFANAERSPDKINQVITFSDMFWLFGDSTTEPWVTTGNAQAPMQRFQGILFDRGSWEGTALKVRDTMLVIDEEGGVFNRQERISNPAVEERIRRAIAKQSL